ncbi:hypothetical protein GCM10009624_32740 [Gordonia sinesedis]
MKTLSRNIFRTATVLAAMAAAVGIGGPGVAVGAPGSSLDTGSMTLEELGELGSRLGIDTGSLGGKPGSPPVQQCNAQTLSGGAGVTNTRYVMGRRGPMSFRLDYETYNIPDRIEVIYQGRVVANTGYVGDDINQGTGSIVVRVPAGTSTSVTVRVTGPSGTDWKYTLRCPS